MKKWIILIITVLACIVWAIIEPNLLVAKNIDLYIPNWSRSLDNTKIAVISDLHIGSRSVGLKKVEKIVYKTNAQKPDIVLFLGDFDALLINANKITSEDIAERFKLLDAPYGVISVLGNHDFEPTGIVKNILSKSNIKLLEDESVKISINNNDIYFVGLKDLWFAHPNTKAAVNQVKTKDPIIVLSHNPDTFDDIPSNVSLILGGHTHGGEIKLPFLGAPFVPSNYGQRFVKGHVVEDNKHIYITSGIGTLSRLRFGNIPEIVILNLYSQENKQNIIQNTKPRKGFGKEFRNLCKKIVVLLLNL